MSAFAVAHPALSATRSPIEAGRSLLADMARAEPVFLGLALLLAASMVPTLAAAALDARLVVGENPWIKPLRFELALTAYTATLALFARWVPAERRASCDYRLFRTAVVAAIVIEMLWVGGAAALGVRSHFNATPLGMALYPIMGVLALLLTSASTVYGVLIVRNPATGLAPALREGVVAGLLLTLPLTLTAVVPLASGMGGVLQSDAGGAGTTFALFNWSKPGGALHAAHFLGAHSLHAVPIFAAAAAVAFGSAARWPVRIFAAAYAGLVVAVVAWAVWG